MKTLTWSEIEEISRRGDVRLNFIVRHAERPPLEPGDRTFGATLPLTARGERDAEWFGRRLYEATGGVLPCVWTGGTRRTVDTGIGILRGYAEAAELPRGELEVRVDPMLGGRSPFFGNLDERLALAGAGVYHEKLNDYFRTGVQKGYRPLKNAADVFEEHLESCWEPQVLVCVTHDINVAAFAAARGVTDDFTEETWPGYLDAIVAYGPICEPKRDYGYLRFDTAFGGIDL